MSSRLIAGIAILCTILGGCIGSDDDNGDSTPTAEAIELEDVGEITALAPGPDDNFFTIDATAKTISEYGADGALLSRWSYAASGLTAATDIAADADGNVYLTGPGLLQVIRYDPGGEQSSRIGQPGPEEGQFLGPSLLATDPEGNLYVADGGPEGGRAKILKFDQDGAFLTEWSAQRDTDDDFIAPSDLVATATNVYVVDWVAERVDVFDTSGAPTEALVTSDVGVEPYWVPISLAVDGDGRIYVVVVKDGIQLGDFQINVLDGTEIEKQWEIPELQGESDQPVRVVHAPNVDRLYIFRIGSSNLYRLPLS